MPLGLKFRVSGLEFQGRTFSGPVMACTTGAGKVGDSAMPSHLGFRELASTHGFGV